MVPTADMPKSPFKRRRYKFICGFISVYTQGIHDVTSGFLLRVCFFRSMNEVKNLHYLPRTSEPREVLFEDRTKAHADHIGQSFDWQSTAAVGVLKAVHFGEG